MARSERIAINTDDKSVLFGQGSSETEQWSACAPEAPIRMGGLLAQSH